MNGIGYNISKSGAVYYLNFNYRGYTKSIEIAESYVDVIPIETPADEFGGPYTHNIYKAKNEADIETLINAEILTCCGTDAFKEYEIKRHFANVGKQSATTYLCDNHMAKLYKDSAALFADKGTVKNAKGRDVLDFDGTLKTLIDGRIIAVEKREFQIEE